MTTHEAVHKLAPALAHVLMAEKHAMNLGISLEASEILHHVREVKYTLELIDKEFPQELLKKDSY